MSIAKFPYLLIVLIGVSIASFSQNPHILVSEKDKPAVLDKIKQQSWAKTIFDEINNTVTPYVDRHVNDPQWILSRYLMNRVPGKHYTTVYSDDQGMGLVKWEGNAPSKAS